MAAGGSPALLASALGLAMLAGCAGEISPLTPKLPSMPWSQAATGSDPNAPPPSTVALTATIDGLQCAEGRVVLARAGNQGFVPAKQLSLSATYAGRSSVGVVLLEPGDYHIVSYACRNGGNVTYLGASGVEGEIPWTGAAYPQSLATFHVGRGETLIVGALRIARKQGTGSLLDASDRAVALKADDLSMAELTTLAENHPELGRDLTARPMALSPGSEKAGRLARCTLVADGAPETAPAPVRKRKQKGAGAAFAQLTGAETRPNACRKGKGLGDALDKLVGQVE